MDQDPSGNRLGASRFHFVQLGLQDRIGTITLNQPARRNCLSSGLIAEAIAGISTLEEAGALVLVLRAQPGAQVWSAGHDVKELPQGGRDPLGYEDPLERLVRAVQDNRLPVLAMVEGSVWGGACDLCMSCDMVICAEDTTFTMTPARLGVPYNPSGLVRFLKNLGPHHAKELFFAARPLSAAEARAIRMVNHVVPRAELLDFTMDMARTIASNAPLAVQVLKMQFRMLLKGQMLSAETFERIQEMRREVYESRDYLEGLTAFREKRRPIFRGE